MLFSFGAKAFFGVCRSRRRAAPTLNQTSCTSQWLVLQKLQGATQDCTYLTYGKDAEQVKQTNKRPNKRQKQRMNECKNA